MKPPVFLNLAEVLEIHQDQVARYGGAPGIRDAGLLKSALGMPATTYRGQFLHSDICEMAAAHLFHLVINHPFVDGNRRVGLVAALVFLLLNGYELNAPEDDLHDLVLSVAQGRLGKSDVAVFIRQWVVKI